MGRILLLYASRNGSTGEVANYIANILLRQSIEVDIQVADTFNGNIHAYDAVILGSPIYKGIWMTSLWRTVRRLEAEFKDKPVWGFSLCVRILEPGGYDFALENYLPANVLEKLNLQDYRFFAGRLMNLSISQKNEFYETYDGKEGRREGDYRDWNAIRKWAMEIARILQSSSVEM